MVLTPGPDQGPMRARERATFWQLSPAESPLHSLPHPFSPIANTVPVERGLGLVRLKVTMKHKQKRKPRFRPSETAATKARVSIVNDQVIDNHDLVAPPSGAAELARPEAMPSSLQ